MFLIQGVKQSKKRVNKVNVDMLQDLHLDVLSMDVVTDLSLRLVEEFIGSYLPDDYKEFLKKNNGGQYLSGKDEKQAIRWFDLPEHNTIKEPGIKICLQGFFDLRWAVNLRKLDYCYRNINVIHLFPIAYDDPNHIYLDLSDEHYGKVRYLDLYYMNKLASGAELPITQIIAPSFTDFVNRLRPGKEGDRER